MPPTPDPKIAEPSAGYAETAVRVEKEAEPLTVEQQVYLSEALEDLAEMDEYAAELNIAPPAPVALAAAKAFLQQAVREAPRRYAICPAPECAAVVYKQDAHQLRVDIFFDPDGSASCYINRPRSTKSDIRHYSPAAKVANKEIFDVLREMQD